MSTPTQEKNYHLVTAEEMVAILNERNTELRAALTTIDKIRNSIIGRQAVNWSEHIYPLVEALDKAGFGGEGYAVARPKAEAERAALQIVVDERDALAVEVARMREASGVLPKVEGTPHPPGAAVKVPTTETVRVWLADEEDAAKFDRYASDGIQDRANASARTLREVALPLAEERDAERARADAAEAEVERLKSLRECVDTLRDLRAVGWAVAVHNDYRLNGTSHTFWLLTKGERALKGEGETDAEALGQIAARLASEAGP